MFWHGCNYPWSTDGATVYYGLDFGANVWGTHVGVSTRRDQIARDFSQMAWLGFAVVRWFVFTDGRSGIRFDDSGIPLGPDERLFADLDAALEIARDAGMRLVLVLLDHRWMFAGVPDTIADPTTGALLEARLPDGRAHVLQTTAARQALLSRVFEPLVGRYGVSGERADLSDQVFAVELMNEADFIVEEWERDLSRHVRRPLSFEALATLVSQLNAIVHQQTRALTTMSAARVHNLWAWDDEALGIDFVQLHSYPDTKQPQRDVDVFGTPAAALGMRRPVVLGEFPGDGPRQHPANAAPPPTTIDEYLEFAVDAGYAGAWPWSFSGTDAYGRFPAEPLRAFAHRHPELANPRAFQPGTTRP